MTAGLGHNGGPVLDGVSWRSHCWRQARSSLLPVLPVEIVRLRVKRAKALGLEYKTYAGIRATTGRDLIAFLFSSNALGVFRTGGPLGQGRSEKLSQIDLSRHLGAGPGIDAKRLAARISAESTFAIPDFGSSWSQMRDQMKSWLRAQNLSGDAVLMIGETAHERELMTAGGLAGFVDGATYFGDAARAL
ncbi:hypothetical protein H4P12_04295 [Paracoccus sp. 11-3]|uniref:Uncharacterized protein n=1 Tax=Paracoccus amoyensis TaxID=2760093 RepID=A0A926JBK8_9RHOB|nr:hypothetical protein [Paracoccus amoyensis]MBC9245950.1 hypothetical protein [Paracoccus amoyensis]